MESATSDTVRTAPASSCWTCAAVVWASCEVYRVACSCPNASLFAVTTTTRSVSVVTTIADVLATSRVLMLRTVESSGRSAPAAGGLLRTSTRTGPSLTRTAHAQRTAAREWVTAQPFVGWDVSGSGAP